MQRDAPEPPAPASDCAGVRGRAGRGSRRTDPEFSRFGSSDSEGPEVSDSPPHAQGNSEQDPDEQRVADFLLGSPEEQA
eukprot:7115168-Pyramimonas_sp.AAC.1